MRSFVSVQRVNRRCKNTRKYLLKIALMERQLAGREYVEMSVHERMQHKYDKKLADVQAQLDQTTLLYRAARERELTREREAAAEAQEGGDGDEGDDDDGDDGSGDDDDGDDGGEGKADSPELRQLRELKQALGVAWNRNLPARSFCGDRTKQYSLDTWKKRTVKHLVAVLAGRAEGDDGLDVIVHVLKRLGYLELIMQHSSCKKLRKAIVEEAIKKWQLHWSARHALHIWDKLDLSRSQFETLRHLLYICFLSSTCRSLMITFPFECGRIPTTQAIVCSLVDSQLVCPVRHSISSSQMTLESLSRLRQAAASGMP